uniref:Heat shock 70 kDa protein 12A n=1 Tax=Neogobius melanostomus TaxID=47308 RepID=A0A8C6UY41_9GOBI
MDESYIIAIDLGTAYSGYAYNITPKDKDISPRVKRWGTEQGLDTPKAPNFILFDGEQTFMSFGYQARDAYINMSSSDAEKCYLFNNFKMSLYGQADLMIKAENGKTMKALQVFAAALQFLKEDALKTINKTTSNMQFEASDFTWVMTVPAIWDDAAKQFMREAAVQAGIVSRDNGEKLVIALEPEAASIWCKKLPAEGFLSENHSRTSLQQTPGTQYIVVDCGGGTIDITVHEVLTDGRLKEVRKASGNNMGGQTVDSKFKEFLREIFDDGVWEEYEAKHPGELQQLMYDFAYMKQVDQDGQFSCPYNLGQTASRKKEIEMFFDNDKGASWNDGKIKISQRKMRSFFEESLTGVRNSLEEILKNTTNIKYILLVGGYALSQVLRDHIENQFGSQYKVLCPDLPQEAVLKGAVMFGRDKAVIVSRKSRFTYGFDIDEKFDSNNHDEERKAISSKGELCKGVFFKMIEIDQDVGWNENKVYKFRPVTNDQEIMTFRFFRTERKNPKYIDEWGAEQIGEVVVKMPNTTGGTKREVKMEVIFGDTEITATATDLLSNSVARVNIDFIQDT